MAGVQWRYHGGRLEAERRWNGMPHGCKNWMEHGMEPWQQGASPYGRDGETEDPRQREIRRRNERHARRLTIQRWCIAFLYVLDAAVAVAVVVAFVKGMMSQVDLAQSLLRVIGFAILIDWAHLRDERRAEHGRKVLRYAVAAPRCDSIGRSVTWICPWCQWDNTIPLIKESEPWPLMQRCCVCCTTVVVPDVRRT